VIRATPTPPSVAAALRSSLSTNCWPGVGWTTRIDGASKSPHAPAPPPLAAVTALKALNDGLAAPLAWSNP
jgi:hypothetical protein